MKRQYSITMGTFQMAILLCFNNSNSLTIKDIQENIQLPEKELIKQIQSLIESKLLVLGETPEAKPITDPVKVCLKIFSIFRFQKTKCLKFNRQMPKALTSLLLFP